MTNQECISPVPVQEVHNIIQTFRIRRLEYALDLFAPLKLHPQVERHSGGYGRSRATRLDFLTRTGNSFIRMENSLGGPIFYALRYGGDLSEDPDVPVGIPSRGVEHDALVMAELMHNHLAYCNDPDRGLVRVIREKCPNGRTLAVATCQNPRAQRGTRLKTRYGVHPATQVVLQPLEGLFVNGLVLFA